MYVIRADRIARSSVPGQLSEYTLIRCESSVLSIVVTPLGRRAFYSVGNDIGMRLKKACSGGFENRKYPFVKGSLSWLNKP